MARADLSAMLGKLEETPTAPPTAIKPAPPVTPSAPTTPEPASSPAKEQPTQAGYKAFERKETRLRGDQYSDLTEQARRLNRVKRTGTPRITENTLIRVAIDLLLQQRETLRGDTEDELRKSVGL